MKRVAAFLFMFLFFLGVVAYISLYQNPLNPDIVLNLAKAKGYTTDNDILASIPIFIDNGLIWDILDLRKFSALIVALLGTVICFVATTHLFIDKFFYRKFFEQPALFPAIRRGVLLALALVFPIFFRLINGLTWYNVASVIILCLCIEILSVSLLSKPAPREK